MGYPAVRTNTRGKGCEGECSEGRRGGVRLASPPHEWVFFVTSGVDWCTTSATSSPSHNTQHTHSYWSSSLFRSTDGHTPRDEEKARGDERCRVRSCIVVDESPVESLRHRSLSPTLCCWLQPSTATVRRNVRAQAGTMAANTSDASMRAHTHAKEERSGLKAANVKTRKNKN